jgi:hypothetical protein
MPSIEKLTFWVAPFIHWHHPIRILYEKMQQRDSTLLTSGPFSLGSNDPLLVYGTTTTGHTRKQHTKSAPVTLLTQPRTPKTTAMKRVKSLDFCALHRGGGSSSSSISRETASRFSSHEWPAWRRCKAPQRGPPPHHSGAR